MFQILSGLYVGNFRDSKDCKQLDIHKITHILSIHDEARKLFKAISLSYILQHTLESPASTAYVYRAAAAAALTLSPHSRKKGI
jgi:hypothetical protein